MAKTKKKNIVKANKTKKNKNKHTKTNKRKIKVKASKVHLLKNRTPKNIFDLSMKINDDIKRNEKIDVSSYAPTINKMLVPLKSVKREPVYNCNNIKAFQLKEPLKIGVKINNKLQCLSPDNEKAIKQELKALSANKHIDVNKIIPPVQNMSNCWFNTMFMSFFVSDKGRKFFHYFRQMMIEGVKSDGKKIPKILRNAFSLLNYAIDSTLKGTKFAYMMDTNAIIKNIYDAMPKTYKKNLPFIKTINENNNPLRYYLSLINYLKSEDINIFSIIALDNTWPKGLIQFIDQLDKMPHIIIIEIFDDLEESNPSKNINNKLKKFSIHKHTYNLDSCIIRDTNKQHFCCTLTCEGKEYAYDGFSYNRIVKMKWKDKINKNYTWGFDAPDVEALGKPLEWNFRNSYQMLMYYREN